MYELITDYSIVFVSIELIEIKNENENIVKQLNELEGKEQKEFLNKNRNAIEEWKIATRYLKNNNIDISKYDEYKERYKLIIEKVEELREKREELFSKNEKYEELFKEIKSINSIKLQTDKNRYL